MSFTTDIKSELCHLPVTDDTVLAEMLGMLLFAGQFSRESLRIQCEMPAVRRRVQTILNQYFDVWPEENDTILQVWDRQDIYRIFEIYGYEREELTHTSVAAQIANNSADAGMGIYSAAKLYDLDFIPICIEEYDLLIPDRAWDTPMVQSLLKTLKSEVFREKILAMGGYTLDAPGEIIPFDADETL